MFRRAMTTEDETREPETSEAGTDAPQPRRRPVAAAAGAAVGLAVAVGLFAVYGMPDAGSNPAAVSCADARPVAQRIAPLARGELAAVTVPPAPQPLPDLAFNDASGTARTLADFRGRTVLLNLWATWCLPCRVEMPALDALQARLGSDAFEVVAVNIDTRNTERPPLWLKQNGVDRLAYYADHSAKIFQDLKAAGKAFGMPTTLLIDPAGCELGNLAGPAEWASEDAVAFVEAALEGAKAAD